MQTAERLVVQTIMSDSLTAPKTDQIPRDCPS
jgi:hypothetical protein